MSSHASRKRARMLIGREEGNEGQLWPVAQGESRTLLAFADAMCTNGLAARFWLMAEHLDHIEATVQQMAKLHTEHDQNSGRLQRAADFMTDRLGRPGVLLFTIAIEALWIGLNLAPFNPFNLRFDAAPFSILNLVVSALALNVTILVLTTQRRDNIAARRRAQLTLQLAALSEQKIAKVISLLEEQRQDNPTLNNRTDLQAEAMSVAADPGHVLDRIIDTHEDAQN